MDCIIQVTKWLKSELRLEEWTRFLAQKGFNLAVRKKQNKEGKTVYGLFRNLSEIEKEELNQKKYTLVRNSLERMDFNGRRIK